MTAKKILLGNTHLTPGIDETTTRKKQLQSLIGHLKSQNHNIDFIILGGDFNLSPDLNRGVPNQWYDNQYFYILFNLQMKKNGFYLFDTYKTVQDDMGFTQDRKNPITAMSLSTKNEPEQRLDFIWAGSARINKIKNLAVISSHLIFNESISLKDLRGENVKLHLSDHFDVISVLSLFDEEI